MYAVCEDAEVNGGPFYVMERLNGRVLTSGDDTAGFDDEQVRAASTALVRTLAHLHAIEPAAVGLGDFGRPEGYLERQVRRWAQQWERSKQRELPEIDELVRRLNAALPEQGAPAIVHGDYNFRNVMLDAVDVGRLIAVFDWEMATLGDPLADLGLLLAYWGRQDDVPAFTTRGETSPVSGPQAWPSNEELIELYAGLGGRAVDAIDFYLVLALYKLAVIVEGIYARYRQGLTVAGVGSDAMARTVVDLALGALAVASHSSIPGLTG
jgi:aminoglycoside phosphotransferase (APT) family kinase protein